MATPSAKQRIVDIVTNIRKARYYVATIDQDAFEKSDVIQDAVLRRLQNASEALTRLRAEHPIEYERLQHERELSLRTGITQAAISKMESPAKGKAYFESIAKIADALGALDGAARCRLRQHSRAELPDRARTT